MDWESLLCSMSQEQLDGVLRRLLTGSTPGDDGITLALTRDFDPLGTFWSERYLKEYIPDGGSKIKFVTGKHGSGVSQLLESMRAHARREGYYTASLDAEELWLHDFKDVYLHILGQIDLDAVLRGCAARIVEELGYAPGDIPEGKSFADILGQNRANAFLALREIRSSLSRLFLDNPLLDNNFASCCSLLTGDLLGHPLLDPPTRELVGAWMHGDGSLKLSTLTAAGLSPYRLTRFNARHMLRSLCEIIRISGAPGLVVTVDRMETVLNATGMEKLHYTKLRRDDLYESIRQLIDDIDTMHHVMFLYGFERSLYDDLRGGIHSYPALLMRIQNEIKSERFNLFTDMANLDDLNRQEMNTEKVVALSGTLYTLLDSLMALCPSVNPEAEIRRAGLLAPDSPLLPMHVMTEEEAGELLRRLPFLQQGLPRMVLRLTLGTETLYKTSEDSEEGGADPDAE